MRGNAPDGDSDWLAGLRAEGLARFGQAGLPTPKLEDWKYTDLKALNSANLVLPGEASAVDFGAAAGPRLCFADGRYMAAASIADDLPKGVSLLPLAQALVDMPDVLRAHLEAADAGALADLNTAYLQDGAVIIVDGAEVTLALDFLASGSGEQMPAFHPRNIVIIQGGAQVTLLESHAGADAYFANHVTSIAVEDGARLNHIKAFNDSSDAFNTSLTRVRIGADGYYGSAILDTGGKLLRNEMRIELAGEGAETSLAGAYLARGGRHADHTTRIDHLTANTTSRQIFRGALDGKARAVFQGNIVVAEGADGSDGRLANNTIMLSEGCEIDTKPQLEIYADEVKCAHGSTVGELDDDAMFYLRSRGVPEAQARAMLVEGFVATVFDEFDGLEGVEKLRDGLADWLAGLEQGA
jgi:Fe-S cluster assembly protein SufD